MLNWNGWEDTVEAIDSLLLIDYPAFRLFVIDNASDNQEGVRLRQQYGQSITVIIQSTNIGFCGGNNSGLQRALLEGFDYFLLINNDVAVEKNFLTELVKTAEKNPQIGMIGPKIVLYYDRSRIDSVGGYVNFWTATGINLKKTSRGVRTDLDFVHGACLMVRREVLTKIGYLDESYFSYWEETDWCLRTKKVGWLLACNPESVIYHKVGRINKYLSLKYIYYMVRNSLLCMKKNGRWYQWPSFLLFFFGKYILGYSLYLLINQPRGLSVVWTAIHDFSTHQLGKKAGL